MYNVHTQTMDIHFWAKEKISGQDPDSLNPDPAFQVNPDPDPRFDDQKMKEKI